MEGDYVVQRGIMQMSERQLLTPILRRCYRSLVDDVLSGDQAFLSQRPVGSQMSRTREEEATKSMIVCFVSRKQILSLPAFGEISCSFESCQGERRADIVFSVACRERGRWFSTLFQFRLKFAPSELFMVCLNLEIGGSWLKCRRPIPCN